MDDEDEILDLVDANDHVIGTIMRRDSPRLASTGEGFIRAASCFIMNDQGKLWIPRRLPSKSIAPNGLDFSAGGHVGSGETYAEAMLRELAEETGLHIQKNDLSLIKNLQPAEIAPYYYFESVYLIHADAVPSYNHADFSGFEWLSPIELQSRLKSGAKAKHSILPALESLLSYLAEHNTN